MSNFHFSLQQVLRYREQLKDQAQVAFAKAQAEVLAEEKRLQIISMQLQENSEKLTATPLNEYSERWLLENFIKGLRQDTAETNTRLIRLRAIMQEEQAKLRLAMKEFKVLDKLKEKKALQHAFELKVQEQKTYDETAALRYKNPNI